MNSPQGNILPTTLLASALVAFMGLFSFYFVSDQSAEIKIELLPVTQTVVLGDTFDLQVMVTSDIPTNVYAGEIIFDPEIVAVAAINYNTSIAELWAEEPWYSNGAGTINFAGGTTRAGGFQGRDTLLTITFQPRTPGDGNIALSEARVLQHDGLGSDASIAEPIDALFTIETGVDDKAVTVASNRTTNISILPERPSTDLNSDGQQSIADTSIFMLHVAQQNLRSDFNLDGRVNTADLSILFDAN